MNAPHFSDVARDATRDVTRGTTRGVTLIELVMTLAVLAILGALALPSFGARADRARLQHAAESLAVDLGSARFEAAQRGESLHVQATAGSDWCWAVSRTPGCTCGAPQPCQLHRVRAADHPGVTLRSGGVVHMTPTGELTGTGPFATLESVRGEQLRVDMSPLGRARVCVPDATTAWQVPRC